MLLEDHGRGTTAGVLARRVFASPLPRGGQDVYAALRY
jgi:hypothetical protein